MSLASQIDNESRRFDPTAYLGPWCGNADALALIGREVAGDIPAARAERRSGKSSPTNPNLLELTDGRDVLNLMFITGPIMHAPNGPSDGASAMVGCDQLSRLGPGRLIVVLDSPGGFIGAAAELAADIRRVAENKQVVVYARRALGAAVLLAMAGNEVVVGPMAQVGDMRSWRLDSHGEVLADAGGADTIRAAALEAIGGRGVDGEVVEELLGGGALFGREAVDAGLAGAVNTFIGLAGALSPIYAAAVPSGGVRAPGGLLGGFANHPHKMDRLTGPAPASARRIEPAAAAPERQRPADHVASELESIPLPPSLPLPTGPRVPSIPQKLSGISPK